MRVITKLVLAALLVTVACASTGGSALFRRDVGSATGPDALERGSMIVQEFHYEIDRRQESPELVIETHWRRRPVFDDERALGIDAAESRVIITGRQRVDTLLGSLYTLTLVVENRTRLDGGEVWRETVNTPSFVEYADRMAKRLEEEFRTIGVRRF
jgi:hypothetical protein